MIPRIDHYKNVSVEYVKFFVRFTDLKTGNVLHQIQVMSVRKEKHADQIQKIIDSQDKFPALYDLATILSEECEKHGIIVGNHWRFLERSCKNDIAKWQRFIDSGDIGVTLESHEETRTEQVPYRLHIPLDGDGEEFISLVKE